MGAALEARGLLSSGFVPRRIGELSHSGSRGWGGETCATLLCFLQPPPNTSQHQAQLLVPFYSLFNRLTKGLSHCPEQSNTPRPPWQKVPASNRGHSQEQDVPSEGWFVEVTFQRIHAGQTSPTSAFPERMGLCFFGVPFFGLVWEAKANPPICGVYFDTYPCVSLFGNPLRLEFRGPNPILRDEFQASNFLQSDPPKDVVSPFGFSLKVFPPVQQHTQLVTSGFKNMR